MYEVTAIEIAKSKMREKKAEDYILRFRHIRLDSGEKRIISADNQWYIVLEKAYYISVKSKAGIYDWRDQSLREMQHVHTGKITLENAYKTSTTVKFLQVIPLKKENNE